MLPKFKLLAAFAIAFIAFSAMVPANILASTTTQTFTPIADAYISQSNPTTNYGSSTSLRVDGSPIQSSYLRFNLSGLSSGSILSATLSFYANSSLSAGFSVNQVANDTWTESSLNYNNAPPAGAAINKSGAAKSGAWVSTDVTAYITGNGTYNLALLALSSTALNLASRESGAHAPQLVLTLSSSGPIPTNTLVPTGTLTSTHTPTPTGTLAPTGTLTPTHTPTPSGATQTPTPTTTGSGQVPTFSHVIVMIFENKEYSSVIGSSSWPNLNALAKQNALLTKFYAVSHPSLPNYLALTSGSTQGITSDCTSCYVNATNIADSVEDSGRTFKAYMESMPSPCYIGSSGEYAQRHNPFIYYDDIRTNTTRCQKDVVPLTQLDTDLANNQLPAYAWITPNVCDDAHDCSGSTADNFLGPEVAKITGSSAFDQNSLLVITFDEGTSDAGCCGQSSGGGHIATVLISKLVQPGAQDATSYSFYGLLKTIEKSWNLPYLGHSADSASTLITAPWK